MSSDYFPWDDIYEGNVFPSGIFMFEIEEIIPDNESSTGKLMPKSRLRCVEPDALKGGTHFDQYVCGTDENPMEVNNGTFGAKALKAIFKAAQTPKGTSLEELAKNSVGNRLLIQFGEPTEDEWGLKSKVVTYHKVGEREVGMTKVKGGGAKVMAKSSAKLPPPTTTKTGSAAKTPATLPCAACGKQIARKDYAAHVLECEG